MSEVIISDLLTEKGINLIPELISVAQQLPVEDQQLLLHYGNAFILKNNNGKINLKGGFNAKSTD